MEFGTPLDCVLAMRFQTMMNMESKEYNISIADLNHILGLYDQTEELLLNYGGIYMRPLTGRYSSLGR